MEHLNLEQLARLVDEQPTPEEQRILDKDPGLKRELEALRSQTRSLRDLPALLPPPGGWHQLEKTLVSAGLISSPAGPIVWRKWLQVAAALVIFIGGTAFGWVTAEAPASVWVRGGNPVARAVSTGAPGSIQEALLRVETTEREYRQASAHYRLFLNEHAGQQINPNPATRVPFLDAMVAAGYLAAEALPADPFINAFLIETLAERDQTLRQVRQDNWH
jgi:hypothetical protein